MIQPNEGKLDRTIRVVAGLIALVVAFTQIQPGLVQTIVIALGGVLLITGIIGYCGLYAILGINTCKIKK